MGREVPAARVGRGAAGDELIEAIGGGFTEISTDFSGNLWYLYQPNNLIFNAAKSTSIGKHIKMSKYCTWVDYIITNTMVTYTTRINANVLYEASSAC